MKFLSVLALLHSFAAKAAWNSSCYVTAEKNHGITQVLSVQKNLFIVIANETVVIRGKPAFLPGKTELAFDEILKGYNGKKVNCYYGQYAGSSPQIPAGAEIEFQLERANFNSPMIVMYARFNSVLRIDSTIYKLSCQVVPAPGASGKQEMEPSRDSRPAGKIP